MPNVYKMKFIVSKKNNRQNKKNSSQKTNIFNTGYLPIQKEEKISPNKSSEE